MTGDAPHDLCVAEPSSTVRSYTMGLELSGENIHTLIYHRLLDVIPDLLTIEESGKSEVERLMPLNLDVIQRTPEKLVIAMSHYHRHESGDMIAHPDMEIAVYMGRGMPEALIYQVAPR